MNIRARSALVLAIALLAGGSAVYPQGTNQPAGSPTKPLKGRVEDIGSGRIPRPVTKLKGSASEGKAGTAAVPGRLSEDFERSFEGQAETPSITPLNLGIPATDITSVTPKPTPSLPPTPSQPTPQTSATAGEPIMTPADYHKKPQEGKKVVIRLKHYKRLFEQEVVWEALYSANKMVQHGADVTILLELEAVNAANRHDIASNEFDPERGSGNSSSTGKNIRTTALMEQFIAAGGKVYASERFAKIFGLHGQSRSQLVSGVQLLNDDDLADFILENASHMVSY